MIATQSMNRSELPADDELRLRALILILDEFDDMPTGMVRLGEKRAPCPFTEASIKRAIRGAMAAGVTPGRIVVTRDGFAIELGASGAAGAGGSVLAPIADDPEDDDEDLWAKKLLNASA